MTSQINEVDESTEEGLPDRRADWTGTRHGPRKKSLPKDLLISGAVGAIIVAAATMIYILTSATSGYTGYWYFEYPFPIMISAVILSIGVIIHSLTYLGFFAHHRSPMGLTAFIFAVVGAALYLFFVLLSIEQRDSYWGLRYSLDLWSGFTATALLGLGFVVMGSSLIVDREHFPAQPLFMTAGILQIVAGSLTMSFFLMYFLPIAWTFLFASMVLTGIAVFTAASAIGRRLDAERDAIGPEEEAAGPEGRLTDLRFCPNCGRRTEGTPFCGYCGERLGS